MKRTKKYGVRRWCERRERSDGECFELYEVATGKCASFPMFKYEAIRAARARNAETQDDQ